MKTSLSLIVLSFAAVLATTATGASAEMNHPPESACEMPLIPTMPLKAMPRQQRDEIKVRALVRDGAVQRVEIVSGPRGYAAAIRTAMQTYRCRVQDTEFWVDQDFVFNARLD